MQLQLKQLAEDERLARSLAEESQYGHLPYEPRRSRQQQQQQEPYSASFGRDPSEGTSSRNNDELENVLNSVKAAAGTARTLGESAAESARTFGLSVFKQIQNKIESLDKTSGNPSDQQQASPVDQSFSNQSASTLQRSQPRSQATTASSLPYKSRYAPQTNNANDCYAGEQEKQEGNLPQSELAGRSRQRTEKLTYIVQRTTTVKALGESRLSLPTNLLRRALVVSKLAHWTQIQMKNWTTCGSEYTIQAAVLKSDAGRISPFEDRD